MQSPTQNWYWSQFDCQILSQVSSPQPTAPHLQLATKALQEWEKRTAITDAMIWGAHLTKTIKSRKEFTALQTSPGLQRFVVVSAGRPQFKLVHRSITIPKNLAAKYGVGAGPIRVRLYIKRRGETWSITEASESFTASWFDLPKKYKIRILSEHETGKRPSWSFWYRPTQSGEKAKKAAMELLTSLNELAAMNLDSTEEFWRYTKIQIWIWENST